MDSFSDALVGLAAPRLGPAVERTVRQSHALSGRPLRRDLGTGVAWSGDHRMRAGVFGSYAEDRTFQWVWAVPSYAGTPAAAHAERLREIGERHDVPELTEPLIDLGRFIDPRAAADDLAVLALALVDATGVIRHGHGGRALTFIVTDAPDLASGAPEPGQAESCLRRAADLLDDHGARHHVDAMVRGYADHHGLTVAGSGIELPGGRTVPVPAKDDDRSGLLLVPELDVDAPVPASVLTAGAPAVARTFGGQYALTDDLREDGVDWRTSPAWDAAAGTLGFGGARAVQAREIGVSRPAGAWEWADWDGAARARELFDGNGAAPWAAAEVDLTGHPRRPHVVELLARSAADLGGAWGVWTIPGPGGQRYFALTDPDRPGVSPDAMLAALQTSADIVQQLVLRQDRYEVTRAMTLGLFERCGYAPWHVGEPDMLMGVQGLYQARAYVSVDGTIHGLAHGLFGDVG